MCRLCCYVFYLLMLCCFRFLYPLYVPCFVIVLICHFVIVVILLFLHCYCYCYSFIFHFLFLFHCFVYFWSVLMLVIHLYLCRFRFNSLFCHVLFFNFCYVHIDLWFMLDIFIVPFLLVCYLPDCYVCYCRIPSFACFIYFHVRLFWFGWIVHVLICSFWIASYCVILIFMFGSFYVVIFVMLCF